MRLRRFIDRALSRWFVRRDRYDRAAANVLYWRVRYFNLVEHPLIAPLPCGERFVVTTDYERGLPCS